MHCMRAHWHRRLVCQRARVVRLLYLDLVIPQGLSVLPRSKRSMLRPCGMVVGADCCQHISKPIRNTIDPNYEGTDMHSTLWQLDEVAVSIPAVSVGEVSGGLVGSLSFIKSHTHTMRNSCFCLYKASNTARGGGSRVVC